MLRVCLYAPRKESILQKPIPPNQIKKKKIMSISRYLFFSTEQRPRQCLNLLQRLGPFKRVQSSCFSKSTRQNHWKHTVPQVEVELQAPRFLAIPAAILGFAGLAAFVHYNDERRAVPKGRSSDCVNIKGPIIGGPFTLINTQNKVVTEKDFLGNWVLLYFGYTSSPDVGPEQLKLITKAINTLESKENLMVLPMFVTLDPQRDNPPHLRAYLEEFESRIVGLTGPVGAIRQMAQEYRVYFRKVEEEGGDYLVDTSITCI